MKIILKPIAAFSLLAVLNGSVVAAQDISPSDSICEFVAETSAALNSNISRMIIDGNRTAPFVQKYLLQDVVWEKEGSGRPKLAEGDDVYDSTNSQYYETHVRWSHDMGYLPYRGRWYKLLSRTDKGALRIASSTGAYPSSILDANGLQCAFDTDTIERSSATRQNLRLGGSDRYLNCDHAISSTSEIFANIPLHENREQEIKIELAEEYYRPEFYAKNTYIIAPFADGKGIPRTDGPIMQADIDNNGAKETLLRLNFSTANNSPCDVKYFDLISEDMMTVGDAELREKLLASQGIKRNSEGKYRYTCGLENTILSVNDRTYISSEQKLFREIYEIREVGPVPLCESTFTIKPIVVFDATKSATSSMDQMAIPGKDKD